MAGAGSAGGDSADCYSGPAGTGPLAKLSKATMRESAIRSAMLVETVQGMDDIKLLRAEPYFQNQWNHLNEVISKSSQKQRSISGLLMSWTSEVQTIAYVGVVLVGASCHEWRPLYRRVNRLLDAGVTHDGTAGTTGDDIGRWQQAKVAREGLENLLTVRSISQSAASGSSSAH